MLTGLMRHVHKAKFLVNENSTTILTGMGVTGTVATAYLTGRATFKAADLIAKEKQEREKDLKFPETQVEELPTMAKAKMVWRLYLPPIGVGAVTIASIIVANKIASKKIVALTVASGISERALKEYKEKVVERLGENENRKIRDEIAQDRVTNNPVSSQVVVVGNGDVLCMDNLTGRYFLSSVEDIKRAVNTINRQFNQHMYASLSEFYDELGLRPTDYTDSVGWNGDEMLDVVLSTTLSDDKRPCIVVDFNRPPVLEYAQFYN